MNPPANDPGQPGQGSRRPESGPMSGLTLSAMVASIIFGPLGIVLGHLALRQIKKTDGEGRGVALAATVIGYIMTAAGILSIVVALTFWNSLDDYDTPTSTGTNPPSESFVGAPR
ncbi:DUF4190 domain-containing protein [Williamsia sp. 1135]|uniref:DUF4190 domain-containing protein n=1 Tax=Williamsia sp. 1135 TaxID=1889262 RepID=UPI001439F49C|nr:DUF4190 domain-containing protein [Williamsia sp. 1135]